MASPVPPVHLEWVAPEGCPAQAEMLGAIARIVGTGGLESAVDARVVVTQGEREFHAETTVSASGVTGTRSLTGESCRAVADAAALVIALAANPGPSPLPSPVAAPAPLPAPAPAPPVTEPASLPAPPRHHAVFVQAAFLVDSGLLPSVGFGGELVAGWSPRHWDVEIDGAFLGTQQVRLASAPTQGASVWLGHLGARACYDLFDARVDAGPCLGGGVEWIPAHGFGSIQTEKATGQMVVGSLGGRGVFQLTSRLALRLLAEAVAPSARPTFVIDGAGQVFRTSAASFRATAGTEVRF